MAYQQEKLQTENWQCSRTWAASAPVWEWKHIHQHVLERLWKIHISGLLLDQLNYITQSDFYAYSKLEITAIGLHSPHEVSSRNRKLLTCAEVKLEEQFLLFAKRRKTWEALKHGETPLPHTLVPLRPPSLRLARLQVRVRIRTLRCGF